MPTAATANLPTPKDWGEFEEICADLFSNEWGDRNAARNGRQGQRQNGVDIYGSPSTGGLAGVQCKGKRGSWPPKQQITTTQIDREVAKAKSFTPPLTEFTIAVATPDDASLQQHARTITERHKKEGLFSVHILGWGELTRRLTQYDRLIEKNFTFTGLSSIKDEVTKVTQQLDQIAIQLNATGSGTQRPHLMPPTLAPDVADAIERDLALRYRRAMQRMLFPELHRIDEFAPLANEILSGNLSTASPNLRRTVLLRAARRAAVTGALPQAEDFLAAARQIPGTDSVLPAEARILEARGAIDDAIAKLREDPDPESRATLLSILDRARGHDAALAWLAQEGVTLGNLTPAGIHTLAVIRLKNAVADARETLVAAPEHALLEAPYLVFFRGAVRLGVLFPKPDQPLALLGEPLDVRTAHPIGAAAVIESELDEALADFHRVRPVLRDLGLLRAEKLADLLVTWCELIHPSKRDKALERLRVQMQSPATALTQLQFAFAYDPEFDPAPIRKYLDTRETLVGWNDEELRAALVLRIHGGDARELAPFVTKHRAPLQRLLGIEPVAAFEVQALARAGDATSARLALDENRAALSPELIRVLEAEVARAAGEDPAVALRQAYEDTRHVDALRNLVAELLRRHDDKALAHFAEKLYAETGDPDDLVIAAKALARSGDDAEFVRLVEAHANLPSDHPPIARHYAWKLFERGRMAQALAITRQLGEGDGSHRDLLLEIAIAVETGAWDTLATPLNDMLAAPERHSSLSLIRAAHIAHVSGQGSLLGLIDAAVARAPDDPNVLLGAYMIVLEEGLEERKPQAQEWFRKALNLSGSDGPIKRFELKEILSKQKDWDERTTKLNDAVKNATLPLAIAAQGFRTTLGELLLRNLIGGPKQTDARRRAALPLFSGRRQPLPLGQVKAIAIDPSALAVLAWLGLLPQVLGTYPPILLPAATLGDFFETFSRIRKFQKSQLTRAEQILSAIGSGRLKVHQSPAAMRDPLAAEVGTSFVSLLRGAEAASGYVVRPAPLKRIGLRHDEDADVSGYHDRLVDVHRVLEVLAEQGDVDELTEETARNYLAVQDRRWPNRPVLANTTPLLLDDLALHYLQDVNLLEPALRFFDNVSIDKSTEDHARALKRSVEDSAGIVAVIQEIRTAVHTAWTNGNLEFGPQHQPPGDGDDTGLTLPTIHLLADLKQADAVLIDDRALNKEPFVVDGRGHRVRIVTTLDVLEDLRERGVVTDVEYRSLRHKLRAAGAMLVPASVDEIVSAALRSKNKESAELRALRESISLARTASLPRFPGEMPWLAQVGLAIKQAILRVWHDEPDNARAARLASGLLQLRLRPEEWRDLWEGPIPPQWEREVDAVIAASLAMPVDLEADALDAYHRWFEHDLLGPMRESHPDTYQRVVEKVRAFILTESTDGGDDD